MIEDAEFEAIPQAVVQSDLLSIFQGAIKMTLESLLEEEVRKMIGAPRWARMAHRKDFRNGTYLRQLITSMGHVEIEVPRTRENGSPTGVLGRYQRRQAEINEMITASYVNGVSTRKVGEVTEALLGRRVGRSTVSRVTKTLDQQVEALRRAPIVDAMPYVYLDATFLDARWARKVENISVLVAYGVNVNGHRKLLAVTIGAQESEASWSDLLRQLVDRGLHGVELVIADAHLGLAAAVRHTLPEVKQQRCVVHLTRNVFMKAPQRLRGRVAREVVQIFKAPSLVEARRRLEKFKQGIGVQIPEALECLEGGFAAGTQFFSFPSSHWKKIRSTNGVERLHGEIKRRTRVVGAFPDRASALRLIVAVVLQYTESWSDRRYLGDFAAFKSENIQQAA